MSNLNTLTATAAKLNVSEQFVRNLIEGGHLDTIKVGRRTLVSDAAISKFKVSVAA